MVLNPTLADTDNDGVNDFDEVVRDTDSLTLQERPGLDGDGLNSYFENSTATLDSIEIPNGSSDVWVTDSEEFDTDSAVGTTSTNTSTARSRERSVRRRCPTTGRRRHPDAFENLTGTDRRNPDTDGGGAIDGVECPANFWATGRRHPKTRLTLR